MAQTFKISKDRSGSVPRKHRARLVVSAISKTPITVTPLDPAKKGKESSAASASPGAVPLAPGASGADPTGPVPGRTRGRPRKAALAPEAPKTAKAARLKRARPHRIGAERLLGAASALPQTPRSATSKVPLAASRIVEQLTSLLGRANVEAFRGKRDKPTLTLSKLEEQAIQEALALFQLKVSLQRGGDVRRLRVS